MKKYNVYIISNKGKVESLIGSDLSESSAEKRVMTGLMRIDRENYFVSDVEVGSKADLEYAKELA